IVEVEAEVGRHIGVGRLLVRQDDVHPDRRSADIVRAAVARFHYAGPAAGDDDIVLVVERPGRDRRILREAAGLVVVARALFEVALLRLVARGPGLLARLGDARAAEQHDRRVDAALA